MKDDAFAGGRGRTGKGRRLRGIEILHEDRDMIVVVKEAGILTCPTRRGESHTVETMLTDYVRKGQAKSSKKVYLVHRLDKETSGVMMVAKTEEVQQYFRSRWNEVTQKEYLALVEGRMESEEGAFESYLAEDENLYVHSVADPSQGKFARTEWKLVEERPGGRSLLRVILKSGRRNQIRVHFKEAGHPIVGDDKYNPASKGEKRMCLHAWRLMFLHPHDGRTMTFEAPLPQFAANSGALKA